MQETQAKLIIRKSEELILHCMDPDEAHVTAPSLVVSTREPDGSRTIAHGSFTITYLNGFRPQQAKPEQTAG